MTDNITPELLAALANVRDQARAMPKNKAGWGYKYTPIDEIIDYLRPILAAANLIVVQKVCSEGDRVGVETIVFHTAGGFISSRVIAPPEKEEPISNEDDGKKKRGAKMSAIQRAGSEITYLRRYSLAAMLSLVSDDDTDGYRVGDSAQDAGKKIAIGPDAAKRQEQIDDLISAMRKAGAPEIEIAQVNVNTPRETLNDLWSRYH